MLIRGWIWPVTKRLLRLESHKSFTKFLIPQGSIKPIVVPFPEPFKRILETEWRAPNQSKQPSFAQSISFTPCMRKSSSRCWDSTLDTCSSQIFLSPERQTKQGNLLIRLAAEHTGCHDTGQAAWDANLRPGCHPVGFILELCRVSSSLSRSTSRGALNFFTYKSSAKGAQLVEGQEDAVRGHPVRESGLSVTTDASLLGCGAQEPSEPWRSRISMSACWSLGPCSLHCRTSAIASRCS